MKSSIEDLIKAARGNAVEDFKFRYMQKWYASTPCFHWKELNLSDRLKDTVITEYPSIWLLNNNEEELDLDEKRWEVEGLYKTLVFDWINEGISSLELTEQSTWLKNNIRTAMLMFDIDQDDLILCYNEGSAPFSKVWRAHFEKELKI